MSNKYSADLIEVLSGFESVRKRPGMYIGSTKTRGLHQMLNEVVDNAVEEAIASFCSQIEVILKPKNIVTVIDNGRGIPVQLHSQTGKSAIEMILTCLCIHGVFEDSNKYKLDSSLRGTGIAPINFLSEWLEVTVWRNNTTYYQRYEKGKAVTTLQKKPNNSDRTGTSITFKPDCEVFGEYSFNPTIIKRRLQQSAYLNANLQLTFKDCTASQEKITYYHYIQGMGDYLTQMNHDCILVNEEAIHFKEEKDDVLVEVALQWCADNIEERFLDTFSGFVLHHRLRSSYLNSEKQSNIYDATHLISFVNQLYTLDGGTHVEGVKQGIIQAIAKFLSQCNNSDRSINLSWGNISQGLTGIVSIMLLQPEYCGATKWELINPEAMDIVSSLVESKLTGYLQQNPQITKNILGFE